MDFGELSRAVGRRDSAVGRVTEKIKLTNFVDPTKSVEVEALIDTGAMMLMLPQHVVDELGLRKRGEMTLRYANGELEAKSVYAVVTVEIKGRSAELDVIAEPKGPQALVGYIALERLDLIVDPTTRSVIPNPRSPDMPMADAM